MLPNLMIGPESTITLTRYNTRFLDNGVSWSAGAFAQADITPNLSANVHAGHVALEFEPRGSMPQGDNPGAWYFDAGIEHQLNRIVRESLSGGRQLTLGYYSNFIDTCFIQYEVTWTLVRGLGFATQFFYNHNTYPPVLVRRAGESAVSSTGETYDSYGPAVTLRYRLMRRLGSSLTYRHTVRDSNRPSFGFAQNALLLNFNYEF